MTNSFGNTDGIATGAEITAAVIKTPIDDIDTALAQHVYEQDMVVTAGSALADLDLVLIRSVSGVLMAYKIDGDLAATSNTSRLYGYVVRSGSVLAGANVTVRIAGIVTGFSGLTVGAPLFASTTAGVYTQTVPSPTTAGAQRTITMYGHAISSTAVWLRPERALIFAKRVTLRYGNIETITHPSDSLYSRKAYAQIRKDVSRPLFVTSSDYANRVLDLKAPLSTAIAAFNTATGTTATYGIGNVGGTHIARAQSFNLATYTSRLQSVAIEFGANVGTPYGTMSLHLMSVNAQSASAGPNAILWKSLPFTPVASSVNTITFNDSPILQPGYYAWALVPDNLQLSGNYWQIKGTASDTYASGISATQSDTGGWITGVGIDYWSTITTANIRGRDASAQSFSLAATSDLYSARIKLGKMGSPTGILTLKIYSDVSSSPGSELASSLPVSLANITIPNIGDVTVPRSEWVNFIFPTPYSLVASTTYWIVLETSSSASSTDWVGILASSLSPTYAGGSVKYLQSTWKSESGDWILELYESADPSIPQAVSVGAWWANDAPLSVKFDATTNTTFRSNIEESSDITLYVEL